MLIRQFEQIKETPRRVRHFIDLFKFLHFLMNLLLIYFYDASQFFADRRKTQFPSRTRRYPTAPPRSILFSSRLSVDHNQDVMQLHILNI